MWQHNNNKYRNGFLDIVMRPETGIDGFDSGFFASPLTRQVLGIDRSGLAGPADLHSDNLALIIR